MSRIRGQFLRRTLQAAPLARALLQAAGESRHRTSQTRTEINPFFVKSGDLGGHPTGPHYHIEGFTST